VADPDQAARIMIAEQLAIGDDDSLGEGAW
jgi:hypothetical protein